MGSYCIHAVVAFFAKFVLPYRRRQRISTRCWVPKQRQHYLSPPEGLLAIAAQGCFIFLFPIGLPMA